MMGVFGGYAITIVLGTSTDKGNLGSDFSKLAFWFTGSHYGIALLKPKGIPIRKK